LTTPIRGLILVAVALAWLAPPAARAAVDPPPEVEAASWALIDARTGETLGREAARRRLPMASTTKMMTAYLALRNLKMDEVVRAADYQGAPVESLMGLEAGQKVSVRDLLYGLILLSGNDAAVTLAEAVSGSVSSFVTLMKRTARRLGLRDTSYENPIGLDGKQQYSSARDLVTLGRILMDMPRFRPIAGARTATLRSLRPPVEIETGNEFVRDNAWAIGIKTGHTNLAGYILVSDGRRRATELIATVMGTSSEAARDAETVKLMDYGFSLYEKRVPVRTGRPVERIPVRFEDRDLAVSSPRPVRIGVRDGERLDVAIDLPDEVEGPIARGERLGTATVSLDGDEIGRVPLLADRAVAEPGRVERALAAITSSPFYILVVVFAILVVVLLVKRRKESEMRTRVARAGRRRR
jgi:D-alanyl-D-alanine carboxypeptidase (penicillin-binding protein 5/6)